MSKIKWGILGTGYIANGFADSMCYAEGAEKTAVCATSLEKANAFADKYGFAERYNDFDQMLQKSEIDIVYIAVPNMLHYKFVMAALNAGKHVLCEKPMADNAKQLKKMINKAKERDLFLMEGLWTRCFPAMRKTMDWINQGRIGKVLSVRAEFGLKANEDWQGWKAKAEYAGGAIRDLGIYTIAMVFAGFKGEMPEEIISSHVKRFGADYHSELFFKYSDNRTAFLTNSFNMVADNHAVFYGDKGVIKCGKVWNPDYSELFIYAGGNEFTRNSVDVFRDEHTSTGMQYEIRHVMDCIHEGKRESELFPLSESIAICELIDQLREVWGVIYQTDKE